MVQDWKSIEGKLEYPQYMEINKKVKRRNKEGTLQLMSEK